MSIARGIVRAVVRAVVVTALIRVLLYAVGVWGMDSGPPPPDKTKVELPHIHFKLLS